MRIRLPCLLALCLLAALQTAHAARRDFSFGVIAHAAHGADDGQLRRALAAADADNLAFVLVNGIKQATETCSDALYEQRKAILENSANGLIVSLAADDWATCRTAQQLPAASERLNRLRELLFGDEFSMGASKLPLARQSSTGKFSSFVENARWEFDNVVFGTLNLPANNNHYLPDAGRNSEFEDRQIANLDWLQRIFSLAQRRKMAAIVLFVDADPFARTAQSTFFGNPRASDGYREVRRQIRALAARFPGKVLLVNGQIGEQPGTIVWQKNIATLAAGQNFGSGWLRLTVRPSAAEPFKAVTLPLKN